MESPNRMAVELVDEAIDFADELAIGVRHLDNDAVVLDFGIEYDGGIEAGLLLAEIQTAGLATVQTGIETVVGTPLVHVELSTDHPSIALLGSQLSGWPLHVDGFEGFGSGPARLLPDTGPDRFVRRINFTDEFDLAVLAIEASELPDESVAEHVAQRAGVATSGVFLPTVPVASVCGSVTMAARAAELAVLRLVHLGYDPEDVVTATARAPVAPVPGDERTALGRTNDGLAYGGQVHLVVREDSDRFADVPFVATPAHGSRFEEIITEAGGMDAVDAGMFAPAQVTVDVRGGTTYAVGQLDPERLAASFGL